MSFRYSGALIKVATCRRKIPIDSALPNSFDAGVRWNAHKPWIIKHEGVVYHFYCAVGGEDHHRAIALATSKDLK